MKRKSDSDNQNPIPRSLRKPQSKSDAFSKKSSFASSNPLNRKASDTQSPLPPWKKDTAKINQNNSSFGNELPPIVHDKEPLNQKYSQARVSRRIKKTTRKRKLRWPFIFGFLFLLMGSIVGVAAGILNLYLDQLPAIPYLEDYNPWMPSRVFSGEGRRELIADFFSAEQNRKVVPITEMPKNLINAVIALEDRYFYQHSGISPRGILRAALINFNAGRIKEGASTLTIQLAEDLIQNNKLPYELPKAGLRSYTTKASEAILALQIEKRYTKEEILEIYLNQVLLGGNHYGVAVAAEAYFGKDVSELSLKECALFAGMLRAPNRYAPAQDLEAAERRTEVVLRVMLREKFITQEEYDQAISEPFHLRTKATRTKQIALFPYFSSAIRRQFMDGKIKNQEGLPIQLYGNGIDIESTADVDLQTIAEKSLKKGIEEHEHTRRFKHGRDWGRPGYRSPNQSGANRLQAGEFYDARILDEYDPLSGYLSVTLPNVRDGKGPFRVPVNSDTTWLDKFDLLHPDYYVYVQAIQQGGGMELRLAKDQHVQGALIAAQPSTGRILAMVGGYNFFDELNDGKFNRATQTTQVQPGSAFKPLFYCAALSDPSGKWTPATLIHDVEHEYWKGWTPKNFEDQFFGWVPIRFALVHSLNAASVWLLDNYKGSRSSGIQDLRRFCRDTFDLVIEESNLSLALGTSGATPLEIAQAYAVLANGGNFIRLHSIDKVFQRNDSHRNYPNLLYEFKPPSNQIQRISPGAAYLMTYLLRAVVEEGTGEPAKDLPFYCVGKTGTTDNCTYAWFAGYTKDLLCIVYFGFDNPNRSLGYKMTGSKVALPVWMNFMSGAYEIHPELFGEISKPNDIVFCDICPKSNALARPTCPSPRSIPFLKGTEPTHKCTKHGKDTLQPYRLEVNKLILSSN